LLFIPVAQRCGWFDGLEMVVRGNKVVHVPQLRRWPRN